MNLILFDRTRPTLARYIAGMALQRQLGILSKRRTGYGSRHSARPGTTRQSLVSHYPRSTPRE